MKKINNLSDLKKIKSFEIKTNTILFNFNSISWIVNWKIYFLKGRNKYSCDLYIKENNVFHTEAETYQKFISRIWSFIKDKIKKEEQISLELFSKEKYSILWNPKSISNFLMNYSSFIIKKIIHKAKTNYKFELYKVKKEYFENKIVYTLSSINGINSKEIISNLENLNLNKIWNSFFYINSNIIKSMNVWDAFLETKMKISDNKEEQFEVIFETKK